MLCVCCMFLELGLGVVLNLNLTWTSLELVCLELLVQVVCNLCFPRACACHVDA